MEASAFSLVPASHTVHHKPATRVENGSVLLGDERRLAHAMLAIVEDRQTAQGFSGACGGGLSAPQLGVGLAIMAINVAPDGEQPRFRVLVNPRLSLISGVLKDRSPECCDSTGTFAVVAQRMRGAQVRAYTIDGDRVGYELTGRVSHWAQHHMGHLNGQLVPDAGTTMQLYIVRPEERADFTRSWRMWPTEASRKDWLQHKTSI